MKDLEPFLAKVKKANQTGSKEIRLSLEEANLLVVAMTQILNSNVTKQARIDQLEKLFGSNIIISGGTFKK